MVEWIDFETLALLFGMVITVLPAGHDSKSGSFTLPWLLIPIIIVKMAYLLTGLD